MPTACKRQLLCGCILITCTLVTYADVLRTCPTNLKQDDNGYWYSTEKPGWYSRISTPKDVTLSAKNFGAVVFSPTRQRLACVYKASNNSWIALVSNLYADIEINKQTMDDTGNGPAWKWNVDHKDYSCGIPHTSDINKCSFRFKETEPLQPTNSNNDQANKNQNNSDQNNNKLNNQQKSNKQ